MSNRLPSCVFTRFNCFVGCVMNVIWFIAFIAASPIHLEGKYIERFSTVDNGGMIFTGNAVGLSKSTGENSPGKNDSIGTFMTTNLNLQTNNYPPGTTLKVSENSSAAILDLPTGSDVLYAELIWSGSYGWPVDNPVPPPPADCQVTLTTPQKITHMVKADKSTAQNDLTPGFLKSGNYVRSANVTGLVQLGGKGTYIAGQIPGTIDPLDDEHNAAGWTLAVVYRNPKMYTNKLMLWVGCEQGMNCQTMHIVDDFCTPSSGVKTARLFINAIEGDAIRTGDHLLFGSHADLSFPDDALSGTNNPIDNFFASQINTLIEMSKDRNGKLVPIGHAQLDTRGTFGLQNQDANNNQNVDGARQGYDITSIDISDKLDYKQTSAYFQGQTLTADEDYTIGSLGLQIQVEAPIIHAKKLVEECEAVPTPTAGQLLTFKIKIENTGTLDAKTVVAKSLLQPGLNFIPGSFKINGSVMPDRYILMTPIGDLLVNDALTIEYQATVDSVFLARKPKIKSTKIDYFYHRPSTQSSSKTLTAATNPITFGVTNGESP